MMKITKCLICSTLLEEGEWHTDGLHGEITAHFGSKYDADTYKISVCDDCMDKHKHNAVYVNNYMGLPENP